MFRPRQFPRVRLMFEIASIFLQDESSESRTNTANNRVPRMGFCTNMTLIEAFKANVPILFGGADRVDRKCAQLGDCWTWNAAVGTNLTFRISSKNRVSFQRKFKIFMICFSTNCRNWCVFDVFEHKIF